MSKSQDPESGVAPMPPHENQPPPAYQGSYGSADAVPPSYSNIDEAEPPPSYDSLFGQVRAAREESSSTFEFFKKFLLIILSTVGCTIVVALVLAVPISMIVMGSIYLGQCPREHYIPIYLIVAGAFGILKNLSNIVQRVKARVDDEGNDENVTKSNPFDGILNCFLLAWFIAGNNTMFVDVTRGYQPDNITKARVILYGWYQVTTTKCNVWIYRIYNDFDSSDEKSSIYCQPTLYWFAFWITTASYIFSLSLCCCICCSGLLAACCTTNSSN